MTLQQIGFYQGPQQKNLVNGNTITKNKLGKAMSTLIYI